MLGNKKDIAEKIFAHAKKMAVDIPSDKKLMDIWKSPSPTQGMALSNFGYELITIHLGVVPYRLSINKPINARFLTDVTLYIDGIFYIKYPDVSEYNVLTDDGADLLLYDEKLQTYAAFVKDAHQLLDNIKTQKSC